MPPLQLLPFRFRDPVTGKWVKARYVAEQHEVAARYAAWEIIGPPEIREVQNNALANTFRPYRPRAKRPRYPIYEAN